MFYKHKLGIDGALERLDCPPYFSGCRAFHSNLHLCAIENKPLNEVMVCDCVVVPVGV